MSYVIIPTKQKSTRRWRIIIYSLSPFSWRVLELSDKMNITGVVGQYARFFLFYKNSFVVRILILKRRGKDGVS